MRVGDRVHGHRKSLAVPDPIRNAGENGLRLKLDVLHAGNVTARPRPVQPSAPGEEAVHLVGLGGTW